jgi:hypothetical protein
MNFILQRFMKTMAVGTMLLIGASAAVATTRPAIGTWQLNLAKSTDESTSAPPKSETFVFADSAKGISLATTIVGADGKSTATKGEPIKWDGMAHPESTNPDHDSITVKQVGARTIEWAFTLKGALVRSGTLTVSRDGKMMTVSGASVVAKSGKVYFNDIFDRK